VQAGRIATLLAALVTGLAIMAGGSASTAQEAPKSALEQYLNPFGDSWSLAVPNPDISLLGTFPCRRVMPQDLREATPALHEFVAGLGEPIYLSECLDLLDEPEAVPASYDAASVKQRVSDFKSRHPSAKLLGYYAISEYSLGAPAFETLYHDHIDWFVHREGETPTKETFVRTRKNGLILDITNPDFQDFIAGEARKSLDAYGMDGFLADAVSPSIAIITDSPGVPANVKANWGRGWIELLGKINDAIGPNRIVLANINEKETEFISGILPAIDGVLLEDPLGSLATDLDASLQLAYFQHALAEATRLDRLVVNVVNTNANGIDVNSTSAEQERWFARYYLAGHLIFAAGENAMMLYYTPGPGGPQFRSSVFFEDWNLRVGQPDGAYDVVREDVYLRRFENAYVYLNNSREPYEVVFGECCSLLTPEGERVARYTVPPMAGMLLVGSPAMQLTD
jgi:Hypothetical glycosyl hydrolase family 15